MVELVRSGAHSRRSLQRIWLPVTSILSWVRRAGGSGTTSLPANVAALGALQRFGLEVTNLDAVLEDAHQSQGANGGL